MSSFVFKGGLGFITLLYFVQKKWVLNGKIKPHIGMLIRRDVYTYYSTGLFILQEIWVTSLSGRFTSELTEAPPRA